MRRASVVLALPLWLAACAEKEPAKAPVVAKPPPPVPAVTPIVQRAPSKELAAHFPFKEEEITTLAYSDLAFLSQPEAASALASGLAPVAAELGGVDRACLDAIAGGAKELLVAGTTQQQWVVVLKVPGHALETTCTPNAKMAEPATIEGAAKAWRFFESEKTCAVTADWLACGTAELVKRSLAAQNEPSLPIGLNADEILLLDDRDAAKDTRLSVSSFPDRLETRIELTYDGDDGPRIIHEQMDRAAEMAPTVAKELRADEPQKRLIDLLGQNIVASHRGQRAMVRAGLPGKPSEQAADVGTFASLLGKVAIAERQERRKKMVRDHLQAIADQMAKSWDAKGPKSIFAGRKLVSMPAVPKEVPRGRPVTTPEAEWKGWKEVPLLTTPTFYQYEVKAAPDGQTADLVGRGDLDGNGKSSTFTMHVWVDKSSKQLMIEPKIDETDADE